MPRSILLAIIGLLLLSVTIPAFAQENGFTTPPTLEDLTRLTQFYPADTDVMFVSRIDYPFIRDMDALINAIAAHAGIHMDMSLLEGLNEITADYPLGDRGGFAETFGWLGDTAAFGALDASPLFDDKYNNDDSVPILIAVEINNRESADRFGQEVANERGDSYTIESTEAYDVYIPLERDRGYPYLLISDDAIFLSNNLALLPRQPLENSWLSENAESLTDNLPLPAYHALLGVDTLSIFNAIPESIYTFLPSSLGYSGNSVLVGFASEGAHTYFVDMYQTGFDLSEVGFDYSSLARPVDEAFLRYIPRDTAFVMQSPNFSAYINNLINGIALIQGSQTGNNTDTVDSLNAGVRGMTGADLDTLFGWMEGDYAFTFDISRTFRNASTPEAALESFPVEFAFITEVTPDNEANAQATVDSLHQALAFFSGATSEITVRQTTLGEVEVSEFRYAERNAPPLLIYIGTGNGVFVIGTGNPARFALTGDSGEDFTASETYLTLREHGTENSAQTVYVTSPHLYELLEAPAALLRASEIQELRALLYLFGDLSFTSTYLEDNAVISRMVFVTSPE